MGRFGFIKVLVVGWLVLSLSTLFYVVAVAQQSLNKTINIGLLLPDSSKVEAKQGVELAIKEAMQTSFLQNRNVKLITRSMEGLWGAGATQTVDLVFNHNVWAIIGSHDGRNAHLAEQVIAKTQVVYISAWAGDPTLAQAYVPWFYSLVPSNIQQATQLYHEIYSAKKEERVILIVNEEYDTQNALKYFLQEVKQQNVKTPDVINYKTGEYDDKIFSQIKHDQPDVLLVFSQPSESVSMLNSIRKLAIKSKIYFAFTALGENPSHPFELTDFKGSRIPDTYFMSTSEGRIFSEKYFNKFGKPASPTAAYAYDAAWLILQRISESGFNREKFKNIMRLSNKTGVTGNIQFDELGRRIQHLEWIIVPENY